MNEGQGGADGDWLSISRIKGHKELVGLKIRDSLTFFFIFTGIKGVEANNL
jgi:hypothetical protein